MYLLDSEIEHVLVNTVNALRLLCEGNRENQTAVTKSEVTEILIHLLGNYNYLLNC